MHKYIEGSVACEDNKRSSLLLRWQVYVLLVNRGIQRRANVRPYLAGEKIRGKRRDINFPLNGFSVT